MSKNLKSRITDEIIERQKAKQDIQVMLRRTANSLAGAIPEIGSTIQEFIVEPFFLEKPTILSDAVRNDVTNIKNMHNKGKLSDYQMTKRITNTIIDERVPVDLRMKYVPICLDVINNQLHKQIVSFKQTENRIFNLNETSKQNYKKIGEILEQENKTLLQIKSKYHRENLDLKQQINASFTNIDKLFATNTGSQNKIELLVLDTTQKCNELIKFNDDLVNEWSNVDVVGFEKDNKILECKKNLDLLKTNANTNTKQIRDATIKLKNMKTKVMCERADFDNTINNISNLTNGVAMAVGFFGNRETAQKITLVASAATRVGTNIAALAGFGLLAATINPLMAVITITSCIGSLISGFKKKKSDTNTIFMQLFRQLGIIRTEMHKRFDVLDKKIDNLLTTTIQGLNNLEKSQKFANKELMILNGRLDKMDVDIRINILNLAQQLHKFYKLLKNSNHRNILETITNQLYTYINEDIPDYEAFKERIQYLEALALHNSCKPTNNCDEYPSAETIHEINQIDFDFCITRLFVELSKGEKINLPNPTIFMISVLSALYLTIQQYPTIKTQHQLSKISEYDLNRLKKMHKKCVELQNGISFLKNNVNFKEMVGKYKKEQTSVIDGLNECVKEYAKDMENKYNRYSFEKHTSEYSNTKEIEKFKRTIPFATNPNNGNWFNNGYCYGHAHHKKGVEMTSARRLDVAINAYKSKIVATINQKQNDYLKKKEQSACKDYDNHINILDLSCSVKNIEMPWFMYPKDTTNPLLPVPDNFQNIIPVPYLQASIVNLGHFYLEYYVEQGSFVIGVYFVPTTAKKVKIRKISIVYSAGIYTGPEAIWWYWVGGTFPNSTNAPNAYYHSEPWGKPGDIIHNYCPVPTCVVQQGMVDKFGTVTKQIDELNRLKKVEQLHTTILTKEHKRIHSELTKKLKLWIGENNTIVDRLDHNYQVIMAFLSLVCNLNTTITTIKNIEILNLKAIIEFVKKCKIKKNPIDEYAKVANDVIDNVIKCQWESNIENVSLESTLNILKNVIEYYDGNQVEFNRWYKPPSANEVFDDILKDTTSALFGILNMACEKDTVKSKDIVNQMNILKENISKSMNRVHKNEQNYVVGALNALLNNDNNALLALPNPFE